MGSWMMNKPMAKRGFSCIFKGGGLWWPNGCRRLPYVFSLMLCMVLFLPCNGKDQIDCIRNTLLYTRCENFRDFDGSVETEANLPGHFELEKLCFQSNSLCFPSTLIGFGINFDGLHSEKKNADGNNVGSSKRSPSPNPNPFVFSLEFSPSPYVYVNPPLLGWATNILFTPSLVHLTIGNTHNSSAMHVFEPFSSDGQFYAYGFEKLSLAPGEAGSIAFVFFPRRVGSSSAHVILQTSFGGFVIHAQGLAVQSPYGFQPSPGFELLLDGRLSWSLSLYSALNEVLYVKEINARVSVYSENRSHKDLLICRIKQSQNSFGQFGSFCKIGETEVPWIEVRPHKHWEVPPLNTVALISYTRPDLSEHIPPKNPWINLNCMLSLLTKDSISPQIDITCEDLVQTCCRNGVRSGFTEPESSFIGLRSQELKLTNARTGSLESIVEESLPPELKIHELLEADRLILGNWRSQGTMSNLSVLKDQELSFPVIQIGSQFSKWITVHIPSQKPVVMQLVLNSGAIIDHCKFPDDSFMKTQGGFSIPETATTQVFVHPFESAQIGPVFFWPSMRCAWRSLVLIRNNLSGVEWLLLRAFGGLRSLLLFEGSETVNKIEFKLDLPTNSSIHLETSRRPCSRQLHKELYATNAGELPLKVIRLEVSGTDCGLDGFAVHNCKGFSLASGESIKLLISYQPDFSAELVQRSLKLTMDTGFLGIPMEASLPVHLVDLCKKSLVRTAIWKLLALFFIDVLVICLLLFVLMHPIALGSNSNSVKSEKTIAISRSEKPSHVHCSTRQARPVKKNEKHEDKLVTDRYPCCEHSVDGNTQRVKEKKGSNHQKKSTLPSSPPTKTPFETLDNFEASESPECVNLTVKVASERRRRRKKRAGGGGLASKFEVTSSHSGNSTPSSPKSPNVFSPNSSISSLTTASKEQNHEKKLDFGFTMAAKVPEPLRNTKRPVLSSSASFPVYGYRPPSVATSNFLASSSTIAPDARAPGSKLNKKKGMKTEDVSFGKEYTYDIWGNHFCVHLMGKANVLSSKGCDASEGDSQSFFTRDPQSLMTMSSAQAECSGRKLTPSDIDYLNEIK